MHRAADELRRVEVEIAEEKTAALARIAVRLQELIDEAAALRGRATDGDPAERQRLAALHEVVRERARLYRWYLVVQREAIGLSRHDDVDRLYPLPPDLPDQGPAESGAASRTNP